MVKKTDSCAYVDKKEILLNKLSSEKTHAELGVIKTTVTVTDKRIYVEKMSSAVKEEDIINIDTVQYVNLAHKHIKEKQRANTVAPVIFSILAILALVAGFLINKYIVICAAVFFLIAIITFFRSKTNYKPTDDCNLVIGVPGGIIEINSNMRLDEAKSLQKEIFKAIDKLKYM